MVSIDVTTLTSDAGSIKNMKTCGDVLFPFFRKLKIMKLQIQIKVNKQ